MLWQPYETAPRDGTEVLLKTSEGIVSAYYFKDTSGNTDWETGITEYDHCWVCYDDKFQLQDSGCPQENIENILGWMFSPVNEFHAWAGGEQPVAGDTRVEIRYRNSTGTIIGSAHNFTWYHRNSRYDIVEWRVMQ